MRSVARRALTLGAVSATVLAVLVGSGCDAKKQTEYVAGFSTQVIVPRDLKAILVNVSVGGVLQVCRAYRVYDGRVQLPRSLGEFPSSGKPGTDPVTVTVVGFTEELTETSQNPVFSDCVFNTAKVNSNNARILRRSRQPYVNEEVLFLPMPLKFSCFDKDCGEGEDKTCKAGRCESAATDERLLPRFTADLLDGTGGACFPASECFAAAVPAVVVDPNDCTYAIPNTPSAPPLIEGAPPNPFVSAGEGLNVEITYDGGYNREIIDKEPVEGFFVPDPTKPQRFRLAPGLCDMVKGADPQGAATPHRITAIRASGVCRPKGQFQPLCADDQLAAMGTPGGVSPSTIDPKIVCKPLELKPAPSALMVLADDSDNHHIFYESANEQAVINISLGDPAFRNTKIGLSFFPGRPDACTGAFETKVPTTTALEAREQILKAFQDRNPVLHPGLLNTTTEEPAIGAAIASASAKLKQDFPTANKRALVVLGNRGFDTSTCALSPQAAATAAHANGVETYVIMLARDDLQGGTADAPVPSSGNVAGANAVASAGRPGFGAFDARASSEKKKAQEAFQRVVEDLATCAYDVDAPLAADDQLSYSDPVALPPIQPSFAVVKPAAPGTCTSATGTGNGWGVDASSPQRIRICGQACADYRTALSKASAYALQYKQPASAVPVFSHKAACAPK